METIAKNVGDIALVWGLGIMFLAYTVAILRWVGFRHFILGLSIFGKDLIKKAEQ